MNWIFVEIKFLKKPSLYLIMTEGSVAPTFRPCIWPDVTERHALSDLFGAQHLLGSCEVEEPDIPRLNTTEFFGSPSLLGAFFSANLEKSWRFSTDPPCLGVIFWWGPKPIVETEEKFQASRIDECMFQQKGVWDGRKLKKPVFKGRFIFLKPLELSSSMKKMAGSCVKLRP